MSDQELKDGRNKTALDGLPERYISAVDVLWRIWRGVSRERKSRYRATIWQEFENNIRAAAYTSSPGKFLEALCARMDVSLDNAGVMAGLGRHVAGMDRDALKLVREETALLVALLREINAAEKAGETANITEA